MSVRPATTFLRLALRRAARGTGSALSFFDRRTAVQPVPNLRLIIGAVPWVLVGDVALRAYMPERMTRGVSILVHVRDGARVRDAFVAAGYRVTGQLSIGGFSVQAADAAEPPIDVLTRADLWLDAALAAPGTDPAGYPVLARSYLILMKLQAGRTQDLADVQRLLARTSRTERASVRQLVAQESPDLVEDFDALCTLAEYEFGPPPEMTE